MIIFNEAKPKYEKLDELLDVQLHDIRFSNQVNVIIDLKEILKKFFRPDVIAPFNYGEHRRFLIEEISSDILNIISHYRNYFYKRGKYSTFYFLYSYEKCEELIKMNQDYKKEYYEKYFNMEDAHVNLTRTATKVIEKVISGIPHCYFLDTSNYDEFIYAKYIQSIINKNQLVFILSNDDIFFQLLDSNTFILNLKGIKTELLTEKNCMSTITKKDFNFSSHMIPLVLALSGSKKYSIKGIPSTAMIKACNIVQKLLDNGKIVDTDSISFPIEFSKLSESDKMEKSLILNKDLLSKNYELIRLDNILYSHKFTITDELLNHSKKIENARYFAELNAKIFSQHPLQIEMILRGESI